MTLSSFEKRVAKLNAKRQSKTSEVEREALADIITYLDDLAARKIMGDPFVQAEIEAVNTLFRAQ